MGEEGALEVISKQPPGVTDRRLSLAPEGSDSGHASSLQHRERTPRPGACQASSARGEAELRGQLGLLHPAPRTAGLPFPQRHAFSGEKAPFREDGRPYGWAGPQSSKGAGKAGSDPPPPGVGARAALRSSQGPWPGAVRFPRQWDAPHSQPLPPPASSQFFPPPAPPLPTGSQRGPFPVPAPSAPHPAPPPTEASPGPTAALPPGTGG